MLFFSCSKADKVVVNNEENLVKVSIIAGNPDANTETKTEMEGTTPYWSVGDAIGVTDAKAHSTDNGDVYYNFEFTSNIESRSRTAVFYGSTTLSPTLYAYYPYNKGSKSVTANGAKVFIEQNQYPTPTSFDGKSDILLSEPFTVGEETTQVQGLIFNRLSAVVKIVLKDKTTDHKITGEKPSFVALEANDIATGLVGRVYVNMIGQSLGEIYQDASKKAVAIYTDATQYEIDDNNATYLVVYPQTLSAGTNITVSAKAGDHSIERTINLPNDIHLLAGKITTLKVSLYDDNVKANTVDYQLYSGELTEGDYVIYYNNRAMKAEEISGPRLAYLSVTPVNDVISDPDASIVWHIEPNGDYWTIYNEGVSSYAASTGSKSQAQLYDSGTDDMSLWTVSGNSTYDFVNKYNTALGRNAHLRGNGNSGFACYSAGTGGPLYLYKLHDTRIDPALSFSQSVVEVAWADKDSFEAPVLTNTCNVPVTYSSSDENVATVASDGAITFIGNGTTRITARYAGDETYQPSTSFYTLTITGGPTLKTATINFGNAGTMIDETSVTGLDNQGNTWTITTTGSNPYFGQAADHSQIGSNGSPATSITFTTALPAESTVTSFSTKMGGAAKQTKADITLKVENVTVGTGSLSGNSDVVISSTTEATGTVLTVTVTNIDRGVNVFNINVSYEY